MQRIISAFVILALIISCTAFAYAQESVFDRRKLSEMTDEECIAFVRDNNIEIPSTGNDVTWTAFIKKTIALVEADPDYHFVYNYTVTLDFASAIKNAVNAYYGIEAQNTQNQSARNSSDSPYTLEDSVQYGEWDISFRSYNCYAYALGKTDNFYNPGDFSGSNSSILNDINVMTIALAVKADLQSSAFNRQCVSITTACPSYNSLRSGQRAMAIRTGDTDYHFMKLVYTNNWLHKPGNTNTLMYKYLPDAKDYWKNEYIGSDGVAHPADTWYGSDVYFIIYASEHNVVNTTTGNHYHSGKKHYYEYADICAECNTIIGNRTWKAVVCSGPPCTLQLSEPPLFSTY